MRREAEVEAVLSAENWEYTERTVRLTPVICRWTAGEATALQSDACRWVTLDQLAALEMPAVNAQIVAQLAAWIGGRRTAT